MARRRRRNHPPHVAHLSRQRGAQKFWYGFLDGAEVALGTADAVTAQQRLDELAAKRRDAARTSEAVASPLLSVVAAKFAEHVHAWRRTCGWQGVVVSGKGSLRKRGRSQVYAARPSTRVGERVARARDVVEASVCAARTLRRRRH